jgi:hypothetical protein
MKMFFLKVFLFVLVATTAMTFVLEKYGGYVDYFYVKLSSPAQTSLIVGDSRSMQGVQPAVINKYFSNSDLEMPILNYSFTVAQAAYGEHYFRSIRKKLHPETTNGLFIITVSPFEVSKNPKDNETTHEFFEADAPPHNMHFVNISPNPEYLFRNYNLFHFKAIFKKKSRVHEDGWFQGDNVPTDPKVIKKLKVEKVKQFEKEASTLKKSNYRPKSLDSLVAYLEKRGQVYLVRMPLDKEVAAVENSYWKGFDNDMDSIAQRNKSKYINFSINNPFQTYDGVHLDNETGAIFTKVLCDSIANSATASKNTIRKQ